MRKIHRVVLWYTLALTTVPAQAQFTSLANAVPNGPNSVYPVMSWDGTNTNNLRCDDTHDDTAALNALLSAMYATGGGVLLFPADRACLFNSGDITLPHSSDPVPIQPTYIFRGAGGGENGQWEAPSASSATLDFRFAATHANIVSLGLGLIQFENLVIKNSLSEDCSAFYLVTNTTTIIDKTAWWGTGSQRLACNDIILGGTTTTLGNGVDDTFSGYTTRILNSNFYQFRRIYGRVNANGLIIQNNTFSFNSGSNLTAKVSSASNGANVVLTLENNDLSDYYHGLAPGETVSMRFTGFDQPNWTLLNGEHPATYVSATQIKINGVDSTLWAAYDGHAQFYNGAAIEIDGSPVSDTGDDYGTLVSSNNFEMGGYTFAQKYIHATNNWSAGNVYSDPRAGSIAAVRQDLPGYSYLNQILDPSYPTPLSAPFAHSFDILNAAASSGDQFQYSNILTWLGSRLWDVSRIVVKDDSAWQDSVLEIHCRMGQPDLPFVVYDQTGSQALKVACTGATTIPILHLPGASGYQTFSVPGTGTRTVTLPDANTNTVQPLSGPPSGGIVGYIDSNGIQQPATTIVLPNGTTATTQSAGDNSTKLATTAYVDSNTMHGIMGGACNGPGPIGGGTFVLAPFQLATTGCSSTSTYQGWPVGAHTFKNLHCYAATGGTGSGSGKCQVYKNGVAQMLVCTMGTGGTSCEDVTDSFTTGDGDRITVKVDFLASDTLASPSCTWEVW